MVNTHWKQTIRELFEIMLVFYLAILLIKEFKPEWVYTLNTNLLLIIVVILGVITFLFQKKKKQKTRKPTKKDYLFIIFLGIAGTILVFLKTAQLGWLAYVISIIAGALIILLSILVLQEGENEQKD